MAEESGVTHQVVAVSAGCRRIWARVALSPDQCVAWFGLAHALWATRRSGDALRAYDRAIELECQPARAWYLKGRIHEQHHRFQEALGAYERALLLQPKYAEAWLGKGVSLVRLRRSQEGLVALEQAQSLGCDDPHLWRFLAAAYLQLDRIDEAAKPGKRYLGFLLWGKGWLR
jgi:tetratricopeptide (TPR) repeat protein